MIFSFIDIIYSFFVLMFAIIATVNGFLQEFFSKLAILLGIIAAFIFTKRLEPYLAKLIKNNIADTVLAYLLIFIIVYLFIRIIQHLVNNLFSGDIMQGLDRILGFFFGIIEGIIVVAIIMILAKAQPWINLSILTENSFYYSVLSNIIKEPVRLVGGMFV